MKDNVLAKCRKDCKRIEHRQGDCRSVVTVPTQGTPWPNQGVITCFKCDAEGHYQKDCPKVKNQNHLEFRRYLRMDWLAKNHAVIVCDEKIAQKYMEKDCQLFLAQVTVKENKEKSKEKRLEYVPTVRDFPKVFPEDLPGLPSIR
ncbi:putative reverse transcriptase domain-containing protein [Tanacetum coccineum]